MRRLTTDARCLGCAMAISDKDHRCSGTKPLLPYGGFCQCPLPGCGPERSHAKLTSTAR